MDKDNFILHVKTDDICIDVADVETRFDTSNYTSKLSKGKNKTGNWIRET